MRIIPLITFFLLLSYTIFGQVNMELQANVTYDDKLSDIWGYTDSLGREYALVCLRGGIAIENISNPTEPERVAIIEGPNSSWRDAKTYGQFAYFINESSGGLQIINLKNLPNAPDSTDSYFWTPIIPELGLLSTCHNIYIDEATGYGFLAGCNINNGGVVILDLFTDPGNPIYVSAAAPVYAHDVYTRGDFIYSSDIFEGAFAIQDMSNKDSVFTVSSQTTPFIFTHNAWLSDDSNVIFTSDERENASIGAYDISDKNNIKFLDEFRPIASIGEGLIPHNVHVKNDFLITSYYTEGVIIMDGHKPDNLIEVGNYDTFSGENGEFSGIWGAFPFFESGTVIGSDINNGLFILKPTYIRACYLEGVVLDSISGLPLDGVAITILSADANKDLSNLNGSYKTGQVSAGVFDVSFAKAGYQTKTALARLENGELTVLNMALAAVDSSMTTSIPLLSNVETLTIYPNPFINQMTLQYELTHLEANTQLVITDLLGQQISTQAINEKSGFIKLGIDWTPGVYFARLAANGLYSAPIKMIKTSH
ncbi:MAG: choice-of-anchor B family protein [Saprospiraceae bacterium]